ncbi:hypothetical protein P8452_05975 [Trifolium repens]|nr:hypothetical protein P8452_05975 [Trifolium repens]
MHFSEVTGMMFDGSKAGFLISKFMSEVILCVILVLVGAGWDYPKTFWNDNEKKLLTLVICLQVLSKLSLSGLVNLEFCSLMLFGVERFVS